MTQTKENRMKNTRNLTNPDHHNLYYALYPSPVGLILLVGTEDALTGLWIEGSKDYETWLSACRQADDDYVINFDRVLDSNQVEDVKDKKTSWPEQPLWLTKEWLDLYFSGHTPDFIPAIQLFGTPFQQEVWEILKTIPYGKTISYKDIADAIAQNRGLSKMSAQAVGNAVGKNPISILVPCHRVIGTNGKLTGYASGIERKKILLDLEGAAYKE